MKRTTFEDALCPIARGYDAIGDWWSLLIITEVVLLRRSRFSDIQESLGLAKNILSSRLRKLVEAGILERVPTTEGAARHAYIATQKGRDLYKVLVPLMQWGQRYFFDDDDPQCRDLVDRATGQPVAEVAILSHDGQPLDVEDLEVVTHDAQRTEA